MSLNTLPDGLIQALAETYDYTTLHVDAYSRSGPDLLLAGPLFRKKYGAHII